MGRYVFHIMIQFLLVTACYAQVSHGGKPLPLSALRSMDNYWFEEMPGFDLEEELRINTLNESDLRSGYKFAYKFITDFNRNNSGTSFTLEDGTRVWRLGIRSVGALSLNVLFTEYEVPEGARLFLYNGDQSHIRGAFNHLNNSELGILPVSPVLGDELIIEYQEPADAAFSGRLTIGEVNHGYRSLLAREPGGDNTAFFCMEPLLCFPDDPEVTEELGRSVVLLIINGETSCSGVMVNNTANDGKPYVLTASHCINNNFKITEQEGFEEMAGSIVCYFNYDSPLCDPVLRGTEEMSVSSSYLRAINAKFDMALLELLEIPPAYYQPYYAGWDLTEEPEPPYFGIHHPSGSVKRVNWMEEDIRLETFRSGTLNFEPNSHWYIPEWTAGSTAPGSSGSPLFTTDGSIIGALSGGYSTCYAPERDYYFALSKAWEPEEDIDKQLKHWLNPGDKNEETCAGLNPYELTYTCFRMSNVRKSGQLDNVETTYLTEEVPLLGNNDIGARQFAEQYFVSKGTKLYGAYLVTPSVGNSYSGLKVEVNVYSGTIGPENLLHTEMFRPAYSNYVTDPDTTFQQVAKPWNRAQESFVRFSKPIDIQGKFFIAYHIVSAPKDVYFSALNLADSIATQNTTWFLHDNLWQEMTAHPEMPIKTSLYIDPVIQYTDDVKNIEISPETKAFIVLGTDRKTMDIILPENVTDARLSLMDMNGRIVQNYRIDSYLTTINVPAVSPGVYVARLTYGNGYYNQKIIF